jgi:hypothetical protein
MSMSLPRQQYNLANEDLLLVQWLQRQQQSLQSTKHRNYLTLQPLRRRPLYDEILSICRRYRCLFKEEVALKGLVILVAEADAPQGTIW